MGEKIIKKSDEVIEDFEIAADELDKDILALVPGYLINRKKDLDKMFLAFENKQIKPIKEISHNIKGTALSYGQVKLNEIAIKLDHAASIEDWDAIQIELTILKKFLG